MPCHHACICSVPRNGLRTSWTSTWPTLTYMEPNHYQCRRELLFCDDQFHVGDCLRSTHLRSPEPSRGPRLPALLVGAHHTSCAQFEPAMGMVKQVAVYPHTNQGCPTSPGCQAVTTSVQFPLPWCLFHFPKGFLSQMVGEAPSA